MEYGPSIPVVVDHDEWSVVWFKFDEVSAPVGQVVWIYTSKGEVGLGVHRDDAIDVDGNVIKHLDAEIEWWAEVEYPKPPRIG